MNAGQMLVTTLVQVSYANLINAYFLAWLVIPQLTILLKPLPALKQMISRPTSQWRLIMTYYMFGDLLMEVSGGQGFYLNSAVILFTIGHLTYLSQDNELIKNYLITAGYTWLLTSHLSISGAHRLLIVGYFPVLVRCLTYAYQEDRDRVPGWGLFMISDLMIAHQIISGVNYGKIPLVLYWIALDLL